MWNLYMVHGTISRSVGKVPNLHTVHRTTDRSVSKTRNHRVVSRRVKSSVSALRNLWTFYGAIYGFVLEGQNFFETAKPWRVRSIYHETLWHFTKLSKDCTWCTKPVRISQNFQKDSFRHCEALWNLRNLKRL